MYIVYSVHFNHCALPQALRLVSEDPNKVLGCVRRVILENSVEQVLVYKIYSDNEYSIRDNLVTDERSILAMIAKQPYFHGPTEEIFFDASSELKDLAES